MDVVRVEGSELDLRFLDDAEADQLYGTLAVVREEGMNPERKKALQNVLDVLNCCTHAMMDYIGYVAERDNDATPEFIRLNNRSRCHCVQKSLKNYLSLQHHTRCVLGYWSHYEQ